jgi:hypothetical protein
MGRCLEENTSRHPADALAHVDREPLNRKNIMPKPDHIFDLERRQQMLEEEIARALSYCSPDDPMVADIKRRMLHLKEELERFCNKAIADRRLH